MLAAVAYGGIEQRRSAASRERNEACEIGNAGKRRVCGKEKLVGDDARDWQQILERVDGHLCVEMRIDGQQRARRQQQRRPVGGCVRSQLAGEVAVRAAPVLHHDRLPQPRGERLRNQARDEVGRTAGRKRQQQLERPRRVGLPQRRRGQVGEQNDREQSADAKPRDQPLEQRHAWPSPVGRKSNMASLVACAARGA